MLKKIPSRIIQNAVGLAVFTSMRSGLWTSGSGGSGILLARKTDGTWSPPSGLTLQTSSLGFVRGVDIYDGILIINNFTVLEIFARAKVTLGTDVPLTGGPLAPLGLLENDVTWAADLSDRAIAYVKAKGQCTEVKLDGTVLHERTDENEKFYGMKVGVAKILAGDINQSLPQTRLLTEMLKAAEGRVDYDMALVESLSSQPAPGDATIDPSSAQTPSPIFGVPVVGDPDPFGVMALEMAGIGIREAGTRLRPESNQFEYHPSPTSPMFPMVERQSIDTFLSRSNRESYMSSRTIATEKSHMTDVGTQTFTSTPNTTPVHSQSQSEDGNHTQSSDEIPEVKEPEDVDYTKIDISALRKLSSFPDLDEQFMATSTTTKDLSVQANLDEEPEKSPITAAQPQMDYANENESDADDEEGSLHSEDELDDDDDFEDGSDVDEEPVVFEVATAQAPTRMVASHGVQAKGAVVTIPRRVAPPLPVRSPARSSRRKSQMPDLSGMVSSPSPLRQQFESPETIDAVTPKAEKLAVVDEQPIPDSAHFDDAESLEKVAEPEVARHSLAAISEPRRSGDDYFPKVEEHGQARDDAVLESQVEFQKGAGVAVPVA
ncbi:hypothetical protein GGR56DRAFT_622585 [Xylariaceae sp. FL0804]|nr:hypothetical protein GGR56DRAFT_622585 [Xylariaceae sp. FL0804]